MATLYRTYLAFCLYEAACPFSLWLMAEGVLPDGPVIWFFTPIIRWAGVPGWFADRQNWWIEFVLVVRDIVDIIRY